MMPGPTVKDCGNTLLANSKFLGQLFLRETILTKSAIVLSDISNLVRGEFYPMVCSTLDLNCLVFFLSAVIQILKSVVRRDAISVSDFLSLWQGANKGQEDKAMNKESWVIALAPANLYHSVPMVNTSTMDDRGGFFHSTMSIHERPDFAKTGSLIASKARNISPLFHRRLLKEKPLVDSTFVAETNALLPQGVIIPRLLCAFVSANPL